ncbi:MAG TPA: FHA domain-containing protein [Gammaproteobacteria bacterium]|nr:FHA domain-containing protein [Gammaproteobacteria bacterium]
MGVLDDLKQQAEALKAAEAARAREEEARAKSEEVRANALLAIALPAVFRLHLHLRELAEQLRVLDPETRVTLEVPGIGPVPGFRQEHMEVYAEGHPPDRVVARFRLRYERRGHFEVRGAGSIDHWLENARGRGLAVRLVRILDPIGALERALVTFEDAVPASIAFAIERDSGAVAITLRNFEELGERRHLVQAGRVNSRFLDELSKFILRQPNRFLVQELPDELREHLRRRLERDRRREAGEDERGPLAPRLKGLFRKRPVLQLGYRDREHEIAQLETDFLLGRSDGCDLIVRERRVSRFHARIELRDEQFVLIDESRNGTWVRQADGSEQRVSGAAVSLSGSGLIGLGAPPDDDNPNVLRYTVA